MPNKNNLFTDAMSDAFVQSMQKDKNVLIMGEGVTDPKAIFNTTREALKKFGPQRVIETPVSENAMTGIQIGMSLLGKKAIFIHARVDFSLLAFDQLINNASKWHFMYGGTMNIPIVIRLIIGRGWGQGPQHSQSLESVFSHFPGLKVVVPSTAHDCKGLMISSIFDKNPVVFIEHRWLHNYSSNYSKKFYKISLNDSIGLKKKGKDLTILSSSIMLIESLKAEKILKKFGISLEILDLRVLRPLNLKKLFTSLNKTKNLLFVDNGWKCFGVGSEIFANILEKKINLKNAPVRLACKDFPTPSSHYLNKDYYVTVKDICVEACKILSVKKSTKKKIIIECDKLLLKVPHDLPDLNFKGPF
jgi:pyruvate dehydrogenase E1 component beta subunit